MATIDDAPADLAEAIKEFWPESEWNNAAAIAKLESDWDFRAEADTTDQSHPCGAFLRTVIGVTVVAEHSVGYFQINACNLPSDWRWEHLFNARHNAGTAHAMWDERGWTPWYFSATQLGLM